MKLSSLASRVFLPVPVAFVLFLLVALGVIGMGDTGEDSPLAAPEPRLLLAAILVVGLIQIIVGVASIHLLRGKPLWTYALTGLGLAIVISVFSGEISLLGKAPAEAGNDVAPNNDIKLRSYLGMLGITIPATVIGYCLTWWRFTLVPRQKHRRRIAREQRGRRSREEIASADISDHRRSRIPGEKPAVRKRKRRTTG